MSEASCIDDHKKILLDTFSKLGWFINHEKSHLEPATCQIYMWVSISTPMAVHRHVWLSISKARILNSTKPDEIYKLDNTPKICPTDTSK